MAFKERETTSAQTLNPARKVPVFCDESETFMKLQMSIPPPGSANRSSVGNYIFNKIQFAD